ncbi:MAG: hypothetical protein GYA57_20905 [Myxococcales bacterium]|nr:hypothetical protein [Myxococcales bacterium]
MKKNAPKNRSRRSRVEELERKVALSAPTQKKVPTPSPYPPGTRYGLVRRSNLRTPHDR